MLQVGGRRSSRRGNELLFDDLPLLGLFRSLGIDRNNLKRQPRMLLQIPCNAKEVLCVWIPLLAKHPHETFWGLAKRLANGLETDCRVDVVTQKNLCNFKFSTNNGFQRFSQKTITEFGIAFSAIFHCFSKVSCKCHDLFFFLRDVVFLPPVRSFRIERPSASPNGNTCVTMVKCGLASFVVVWHGFDAMAGVTLSTDRGRCTSDRGE